ncbi:hypothetical protein ING2D1G_1352 [Peptoniphilus sp. ING2-D1G]|nr:hypothetical protein ING2D1G_1352 [Peptoniphilus sp. ING2-D1G]
MIIINTHTKNKRKSLSSKAYNYIKEKIVSGELKDGDIITEKNIGEALHMSRTPVKRAITQLELESYLKSMDGIGTRIIGLSIKDLKDIYEVRTNLETLALKSSFSNIKKEDIEKIKSDLKKIKKLYDENAEPEPELLAEVDDAFHSLITENTTNDYVKSLVESIDLKLERYTVAAYKWTNTGEEATRQHMNILKEIEIGNYETANKYLKDHINWSLDILNEALNKKNRPANL